MSFLAPQAYTKETLAKAFDWLQHQPAHVTQAATTPDNLVAIYLKAQRQGLLNIDSDAPVSSKKFIDDLRSLRKDLATFEEAPQAEVPPIQQPIHQPVHHAPPPMAPPIDHPPREAVKPTLTMDERSLEAINQVKQRFNLSSQQEALRMLISVGYQHIGRWP